MELTTDAASTDICCLGAKHRLTPPRANGHLDRYTHAWSALAAGTRSRLRGYWFAAAGAAAVALIGYVLTLAPTITWHNGALDSGDLATAVITGGTPHPPGYPTYTLVGRGWVALPLGGDPAYRLSLLSAYGAASAAMLTGLTIARLGQRAGLERAPLTIGVFVGGLAVALAPLVWSQATVAEVYAPGLAVISLLGWLLLGRSRPPFALAGLIGALGLGVLPEVGAAAPGALALVLLRGRDGLARRLCRVCIASALGLCIFAYLPWSAAQQPPFAWGDATTPPGFWQLVSVSQYQYLFRSLGPAESLGRLAEGLAALGENLGWIGLPAATFGAWALWRRERPALLYLLSLAGVTLAFRTSYLAEGNIRYLLPSIQVLALAAGVGVAEVLHHVRRTVSAIWLPLGLACVLLLLIRVPAVAPSVDARRDLRADQFSRRALEELPQGAIIVTDRDESTFSLWYRQALGQRLDVVVVVQNLLLHDWYRRRQAQNHPDLNPAALRQGGLTALGRPVYLLAAPSGDVLPIPVALGRR